MGLRKLKKGEQVLVLYTDPGRYKEGDVGTFVERTPLRTIVVDMDEDTRAQLNRSSILAIRDKVVRGPDMSKDCTLKEDHHVGLVGTVVKFHSGSRNVEVDWDDGPKGTFYRMTSDHQDLKPTGGSVDEGKVEDPDWQEDFDPCDECPDWIDGPMCSSENCRNQAANGADCPQETTCTTCCAECIRNKSNPKEGKPDCYSQYPCLGAECKSCPIDKTTDTCACGKCPIEHRSPCIDIAYAERDSKKPDKPSDNTRQWKWHTSPAELQREAYTHIMKEGIPTMSNTTETFDRLERANHIKLVEKPKAENKIAAATEELELLKDEMEILLECPTLHSEKIAVLALCADKDPAISAKATIRALELGLPVTINVKS